MTVTEPLAVCLLSLWTAQKLPGTKGLLSFSLSSLSSSALKMGIGRKARDTQDSKDYDTALEPVPEVLSQACPQVCGHGQGCNSQSQPPVLQNSKTACRLQEAWWEVQLKHRLGTVLDSPRATVTPALTSRFSSSACCSLVCHRHHVTVCSVSGQGLRLRQKTRY